MTPQEIFNKARDHLLKQKVRAKTGGGSCVYFEDQTGNKCGVGGLLSDAEAQEFNRLPYGDIDRILALDPRPDCVPDWMGPNERLLIAIQCLHDVFPTDLWPEALTRLAKEQGLKP